MVTWQGNSPHPWPDRQRCSSTEAAADDQELDSTQALADADEWTQQAEAALSPEQQHAAHNAGDRLAADQLVVEAILAEGLGGDRHKWLEDQLTRYAVPVLRFLLADGKIVSKAARLGRPVGRSDAWLDFTPADREELAIDMVTDALPVFTKAVFEQRRWSPARGASLKTYFVNACILQFPALYRTWLAERARAQPAGLQIDPDNGRTAADPAATVALQDEVTRLLQQTKDVQLREVLAFRAMGYTAEEAAQMAGLSTKAAEGRLARFRKNLNKDALKNQAAGSAGTNHTTRRDISQGGR